MEIGAFGVWTTAAAVGEDDLGRAAALAERLGYATFWLGGSPRLTQTRPLLEATERLTVATSIVNVWAYEPGALAAEYAVLERDFPGRLLVGIGVGHPEATREYRTPLTAMRTFLDGLDAAGSPPPERRCVAALGPRMLALSGERSWGAIPYFAPVAHTAAARATLGAGPLLAPEVAVAIAGDEGERDAVARAYAARYLRLRNYVGNLLRHGFDEADVADGGSERLLEAVVPRGSADEVAEVIRAHLAAGADHVAVQALGEPGVPERGWTALADALIR
ncbi:MAG TPA: TIGR03620 family F420-dependent LLM class oxidoreductase [Gaiellaceae bacterium]|nr:TIGR03620 family F420-dependent LLM class oxidoreductase [Gaiellaceae bacterium]